VRRSQELAQCSDKLVLNLEDDAPLQGPRAKFLVDIMNPCWLWRGADLGTGATLVADVGQFPFNFQIGKDRDAIKLRAPSASSGELEVRAGSCEGEVVASLPLAPAVENDAVTRLPAVTLAPRNGAQDLCFTFTGRDIDPMWAIDRIELQPHAASHAAGTAHAR
jgi:hexosaminidase